MTIRTLSMASLLSIALLSACTVVTTRSDGDAGPGAVGGDGGGALPGDPTPGGGDAGDAGAASETAPPGQIITAGCDFGEPNETRDTAKAITLGNSYTGLCISSASDKDFFEFTTPSDATGGYVTIKASNVGSDSRVQAEVFSAANNELLSSHYSASDGATLDQYFAVIPGAKYRVTFARFTGESFPYDLSLTYTKVNDAYEPNDIRGAAKPISKGTPISAYLFAGMKGRDVSDAEYDDWYSIDLAAGNATVTVESVPQDARLTAAVYSEAGTQLFSEYSANDGASVTTQGPIATAGKYFVKVEHFTGKTSEGSGTTLPDQFTRPYVLKVTQ